MRSPLLFSLIALGSATPGARADSEVNVWPFWVSSVSRAGESDSRGYSAAGPFVYAQPVPGERMNGAVQANGFRPFFVRTVDAGGKVVEAHALYPFFSYRALAEGHRWSIFSLVNHYSLPSAGGADRHRGFDLWPFYFSRETGSAESTYRAVLPVYGSVVNRFGQDRLTWVGFPLFARWEKNEVITTTAPWPFIKVLHGHGNEGFELWPLFGYRHKPGAYQEQFVVWPLIYRRATDLWEQQPFVKQGFLPFYAEARSKDFVSRTFGWPFFGYIRRVAPYQYRENHYLWPLWVQGRGEDRHVNRWAPFYTHSVVKGVDKTWVAWPVWRTQTWQEGQLRHRRDQALYFLYYSNRQRSAANPTLPAAQKTHFWPFISVWDNGAGRRQVQALSPLEVFFPNNDIVRLNYTPLFAVYRYDRSGLQTSRHSLLWNLVTYRRENDEREFHFGPIFGRTRTANSTRVTLGGGLLALEKRAPDRWRLQLFDFGKRRASNPLVR